MNRKAKYIVAGALILTALVSGCAYRSEFVKPPGENYLSLLQFSSDYNLDWDWDLITQKIEIKKGESRIVLRPQSKLALLNGRPVQLEHEVEYKDGTAYLSAESAKFIARGLLGREERERPAPARHGIRTVVIDPGHGGRDPGAVGKYGTREKDIVLDVSKRLKSYFEKNGVNVILTRDSDKFISLSKRPKIANDKGADLFISVHANAARYSGAKGFEVFYLSEATDDSVRALEAAENAGAEFESNPTVWDMELKEARRASKELAYYVCNITSEEMRMEKRGVKGANFAVLRGARMPAVLVEVGFLSNRREESELKKSHFRENIAAAIGRSVLAYKKEFERTNGFSE